MQSPIAAFKVMSAKLASTLEINGAESPVDETW